MFGYITDLRRVKINIQDTELYGMNIGATGHDSESLVFAFLQEYLSTFHETGFVAKEVTVEDISRGDDKWVIRSHGRGECFDASRHISGTEVKAVTYSNMTVRDGANECHIWVIVDV